MVNSIKKMEAVKNLAANLDPPFSRFEGRLKQLHVAALADIFDLFFPRFRTEFALSSLVTRGRGRALYGDVAFAGDSAGFVGRGRERRFSGDETLQRKQYYCVEDAPTNDRANNTLLCELFAYADPRMPMMPELLDSTVDVDQAERLYQTMNWDSRQPSVFHIVRPRDEPWLLSPVLGIGPQGCFLRYPLSIVEAVIERTIDLRSPDTLRWFLKLFVSMEVMCEGDFVAQDGNQIVCQKGAPPETIEEFLPTIFAQTLGGGSTFIQGVGACLRWIGAEALIYPSARANSRSITRSGRIEESFGYVLVDYRDAPRCAFDPRRYFGALPNWSDRTSKRITVTSIKHGDIERLEVTGVRRLQEFRYAVFHDWTVNSFARARDYLQTGTKTLGDHVELAIRRPSDILGPDSEEVLGSDSDFSMEEGGPATGFLFEWRIGPYNTVALFISSVLPAAQSEFWEEHWSWDRASWFLHRLCRLRPWAILKCPVCLSEYFWNIPLGSPMPACLSCKFTQANADVGKALKSHMKWAQQLAEQQADQRNNVASGPEDIAIYSAVCERHPDAITGVKPPVQPKSFGG